MQCAELLKAVNGQLLCGNKNEKFEGITTDSRKVKKGNLFIPLIGDKFDGHDYIEQCIIKGASICLTSKSLPPIENATLAFVNDTSAALRDLAAWYRAKFDIPVVGITGSVGKTSTKDMIGCVLSKQYEVLKTQGNFNNEIGLPLTVFNLNENHEAAILEMGMSGFGEISRLTAVAKPRIAVITNIGVSHIEKLGSQEGILKAKLEILEGLSEGGLLVLNGDDGLLWGKKDELSVRTVYYGMNNDFDYSAKNYVSLGEEGSTFEIDFEGETHKVFVPVPGIHNVYNALAAIAVGIELEIPIEIVIQGISDYTPGSMRQNIVSHKGIKIINDAYNASPNSMQAALSVLEELAYNTRAIAVLGDMLEMGEMSQQLHYSVGKFAADKKIEYIITVGPYSRNICQAVKDSGNKASRLVSFDTTDEAINYLLGIVKSGDYILVKGSRGMKMEKIAEGLINSLV